MKVIDYVDPFFGSAETNLQIRDELCATWFFIKAQSGNTHPLASLPMSMVSVGGYSGAYPTGYGINKPNTHGRIKKLMKQLCVSGFTHFHPSGTGAINSYYNLFKMIPVLKGEKDYSKLYRVLEERAACGRYEVLLDNGICAKMTVSNRGALHHYTFPQEGKVVFDVCANGLDQSFGNAYRTDIKDYNLEVDGQKIRATIVYEGIKLYAVVSFDRHVKVYVQDHLAVIEGLVGSEVAAFIGFSFKSYDESEEAAEELKGQGYMTTAKEAEEIWCRTLGKIKIESQDKDVKVLFYSALYHALKKPATLNNESWLWDKKPFYMDFATLWDQYKTLLPLIFTCYEEEGSDICRTLAEIIHTTGDMPIALLMNSNLNGFKGQARFLPAYSIIDAYYRGVKNIDYEKSICEIIDVILSEKYADMITTGYTEKYTHILDTADICNNLLAICQDLGIVYREKVLIALASKWNNAYDKKTGVLSERSKYYEGTNSTYSFRLMSNMKERIDFAGGKKAYIKLLNDYFGYGVFPVAQAIEATNEEYMNYGHSLKRFSGFNNEPDMEVPYSYNYVDCHDRTCEIIRKGVRSMFHKGPDGLPGNDDSGGLTSCLVWNMLGLFPVSGQPIVQLGSPSVDKAVIELNNGNKLEIIAENNSDDTIYVKKITLNGTILNRLYMRTEELMNGGVLVFHMYEGST